MALFPFGKPTTEATACFGGILSLMPEKMASGGRALLYELVVPDDTSPSPAMVDFEMLACIPGGRERTASEFAEAY